MPRLRESYADAVPMPAEPARELDAFRDWVKALPLPDDARPLAATLAEFEHLARALPPAAPDPAPLAPADAVRGAGRHAVAEFDVDLVATFLAQARTGRYPRPAPEGPRRVLVWNGGGPRLEPLDPAAEALLAEAAAGASVAALAARGPAAEAAVARWAAAGVLTVKRGIGNL